MMLPLNLPRRKQRRRNMNWPNTEDVFEDDIFIDRIANVSFGDRHYVKRQRQIDYLRRTYSLTSEEKLQAYSSWPGVDCDGKTTDVKGCQTPDGYDLQEYDKDYLANYVVRDPMSDVGKDTTWWVTADLRPNDIVSEISSIALPYMPFFSNCEGYDSHMYVAKLLEDNYRCDYFRYKFTQPIDPYDPWKESVADSCEIKIPLATPEEAEEYGVDWVEGAENEAVEGVKFQCVYEESIYSSPPLPRWYEMPGGTELFKMTKYPHPYNDFKEILPEDPTDPEGGFGQLWGRSELLGMWSDTGSELLVPVTIEEGSEENLVPRKVLLDIAY
jgi:hypothetical protein